MPQTRPQTYWQILPKRLGSDSTLLYVMNCLIFIAVCTKFSVCTEAWWFRAQQKVEAFSSSLLLFLSENQIRTTQIVLKFDLRVAGLNHIKMPQRCLTLDQCEIFNHVRNGSYHTSAILYCKLTWGTTLSIDNYWVKISVNVEDILYLCYITHSPRFLYEK